MRHYLQALSERRNKIRSKDFPVHVYASELKDGGMPSYILVLQAQVCRAVHLMCVDTTQLHLLERTKDALTLLAKHQEAVQLDRVLWAVEAKVELQQQEEELRKVGAEQELAVLQQSCVITNESYADVSQPALPGIDNLVENDLSKLKETKPVEVTDLSLDHIPKEFSQHQSTNETHDDGEAQQEPDAASGLDALVDKLSSLKDIVRRNGQSCETSFDQETTTGNKSSKTRNEKMIGKKLQWMISRQRTILIPC